MYEKVNPAHPDKLADRIAGAIVDLAYSREMGPRVAIEVLLGHGYCHIMGESSVPLTLDDVIPIVSRVAGSLQVTLTVVPQDPHLSDNQRGTVRCGDNGVFRGVPVTHEEYKLAGIADDIYKRYPTDGKYVIDEPSNKLIICQSNAPGHILRANYPWAIINPLGDWTGGTDVDTGATNRKLGSDMGNSVTGGGLHGKDLSKGDVSINIYAWLKAQETGQPVDICCAIGDEYVDNVPYSHIVETARQFIQCLGGFERFAEWGLIRGPLA